MPLVLVESKREQIQIETRLRSPITAMNTSAVLTTTSLNPHLLPQEWSHSRSHTEPLIQSPERSHETRLSADGSARHSALDGGNFTASIPPSRPQLKARSTTLASIPSRKSHCRRDSALPKSPSVPTFHTKTDSPDYRSAPLIPTSESFPASPPAPLLRVPSNASTADSRSPSLRRAPASHSSYGVETSNGPPPSFTTQRTLSQDRLWKPSPPEMANVAQKMSAGYFRDVFEPASMGTEEELEHHNVDSSLEEFESISTPTKKFYGPTEGRDGEIEVARAGNSVETLCTGRDQLVQGADEGNKSSGSEGRKSEDIFLNIAQTDAGGQELTSWSERRKVRTCIPFNPCFNLLVMVQYLSNSAMVQSRIGAFYESSASRLKNDCRNEKTFDTVSPPGEGDANETALVLHTEVPYEPTKRHSFNPRSSAASAVSAHPLDDSRRQRYFSSGTRTHTVRAPSTTGRADRESSPELPSNTSHRANNDSGTRSYRRSNLSAFRSERVVPSLEAQERPRYVEQNMTRVEGTESTMSTTAPSTVWDELDELKSRIRKLELTGKLPSSSAAAMSTDERPQTATTTVTTMSSSPKHGKASISVLDSAIDGVSATVHPLLHEALRKARPVISVDIYQKLETTASDALQLASVLGAGLQYGNASVIGASSSTERQLRRKADSMCRGLTELTIALSARPKSPTLLQPFRPSSREGGSHFGQTPPTTSYNVDSATRSGRRLSRDVEDSRPLVKSRVHSRLETRRASLLHNSMINSPQDYSSPDAAFHTPPSAQSQNQKQPISSSRLERAATRIRSRRDAGAADGVDDSENENSPSVRPVSRARTEVGLRYRSARDRTSLGREYTSSHPLPSFVRKGDEPDAQRSLSIIPSSGLPTRRPYTSSNVNGGSSGLPSPATPGDNIQPGYRRYASTSIGRESSPYLSSTEHTPENVTVQRGSASGSRRSLGLTSRLGQVGNFVNGRLRAVRAERERQGNGQEQRRSPAPRVTRDQHGEDQENEAAY